MAEKLEIAVESVKSVVRQFVKQHCPHENNVFEMSFGQLTNWPYHWGYIKPAKWKVEDLLAEATVSGYAFPGIIPKETPACFHFALVVHAVAEHFRRLGKVPEVDEIEATYKDFGSQSELPKNILDDAELLAVRFVQSYFYEQPTPWPIGPEEETSDTLRRIARQVKVMFTTTTIKVEGKAKSLGKTAPLYLAEYVILKERVHWLWAFIILPKFEVTDPDTQFRTYISTAKMEFKKFGIHGINIVTSKKKYGDGFGLFEGIDEHIDSNIKDIKGVYKHARSDYEDGNTSQAINILSEITGSVENNWYTFTVAYMDLADWIRRENFRGISDSLIRCCMGFLEWYLTKLKFGILKIDNFIKKNGIGEESSLSRESQDMFNAIKDEFELVKSIHADFTNTQKLPQEEKEYKNLVEDLCNYLGGLEAMQEENVYDYDGNIINAIKLLCKRNPALAEIIESGRDSIDHIIPPSMRPQFLPTEITELRKEKIYEYFGDVVKGLGMGYFGEFERTFRGDRSELLGALKRDLARHLLHKLTQEISPKVFRLRKKR